MKAADKDLLLIAEVVDYLDKVAAVYSKKKNPNILQKIYKYQDRRTKGPLPHNSVGVPDLTKLWGM